MVRKIIFRRKTTLCGDKKPRLEVTVGLGRVCGGGVLWLVLVLTEHSPHWNSNQLRVGHFTRTGIVRLLMPDAEHSLSLSKRNNASCFQSARSLP